MTAPSAERETELIEDITRQLVKLWGAKTLPAGFVRTQCEAMRDEFKTRTDAEADEITDPIKPWEVTKKRERLLEIKEAGHALAVALSRAPQDDEWLSPQENPDATSGRIALLAELVSRHAAAAIEKLVLPKAKSTPKEDLCARLVWRLCVEGIPQQPDERMSGSVMIGQLETFKKIRVHSVNEYIEAQWAYFSSEFRREHNRLRKLRGLSPLPRPRREMVLPRTSTKSALLSAALGRPYLVISSLFYEFCTGIKARELESSCRKVLEQ
jgi:hypothetical protein